MKILKYNLLANNKKKLIIVNSKILVINLINKMMKYLFKFKINRLTVNF